MRTVVLGAGFVVLWSSGFVGAALGAGSAGASTLLAWRFVAAAAILLAWRRPRFSWRQAGLGVLSQGGYLFGVYEAAQLGVGAGTSALIASLQPIVATVLGREPAGVRQWLGLAGGLAGVAVVVGGDFSGHPGAPWWSYTLPFGAMLALVAATLLDRGGNNDVPLADALVVQCTTSAVLFTGLAAATGELVPPATGSFWFAVGWVVVLSTFGGYGCYWLLLRRTSITTTSALLYLTPATTALLAWALLGDVVTAKSLLGMGICLAAVALVVIPPGAVSGAGRLVRRNARRTAGFRLASRASAAETPPCSPSPAANRCGRT
jgi:drug/metabolite transporter (DMT)-like permease